jgi:hypothetical protein
MSMNSGAQLTFPTLPLSGRQGEWSREAENKWRHEHSRGLFEVSLLHRQRVRTFASPAEPKKSRAYQWNRLSSMATIDIEVAIGSKEQRRVMDLCHPNQCNVSKRRRNILIPLEQ